MGYIRHHAIVVTSWSASDLDAAHATATDLGCTVSEIVASPLNGYRTLLVAPDGSQEFWTESDAGDERRKAFMRWLQSRCYDDGGSPFAWAELQYGDEDGDDRMTAASGHISFPTAPASWGNIVDWAFPKPTHSP